MEHHTTTHNNNTSTSSSPKSSASDKSQQHTHTCSTNQPCGPPPEPDAELWLALSAYLNSKE